MKSVIFVCLGNIHRFSIADGIANAIVKRDYLDVFVDSAWI